MNPLYINILFFSIKYFKKKKKRVVQPVLVI